MAGGWVNGWVNAFFRPALENVPASFEILHNLWKMCEIDTIAPGKHIVYTQSTLFFHFSFNNEGEC